MPVSERSTMHAWQSFVRAKAEVRRIMHRDLHERGLTGSQLDILRVLANSDGGVQLSEISQQLCVTSGNVTGLIDRLEEGGHLARIPHPEDRRVTLAVLTSAGRELFEQIYPSHVARIKDLLSPLTAAEQAVLADLLARIADRATELER
jgi:MarR family 2-MHQ and catechol resistance regulon transcriptional repressor